VYLSARASRKRVSRFLVLDVGSSRRDIVGANVGNNEDHLRPSAISGSVWPFSGGLSGVARGIGILNGAAVLGAW